MSPKVLKSKYDVSTGGFTEGARGGGPLIPDIGLEGGGGPDVRLNLFCDPVKFCVTDRN